MSCSSCSSAVERALQEVPGVVGAGVALATGRALVHFRPAAASPQSLIDAVAAAGFQAELLKVSGSARAELEITGMSCGACSAAVERALSATPG